MIIQSKLTLPRGLRKKRYVLKLLCLLVLLHGTEPCEDALAGTLKRGFAGGDTTYALATNAGWFYNWGLNRPGGDYDATFVPMFWGGVSQAGIDQVLGYGDVTHVLGFNEPERADQANLTVAQAISRWQTLEAGFAGTGTKLVSPAVSDNGDGQQWLSSFMSQADNLGLQVDAVAFHWYGVSNPNNPVGAANSLLSRVDSYHNTYNKPVWLTEFAIHDWGNNYTDEEIREANRVFLQTVIPGLESRSYVDGYSFYHWFSDAMVVEGSPLTPSTVGDVYIPTIQSGSTFDLDGQNQGDDRLYMKGGTLTNSGPEAIDAVRYLDVVSGANTLSGTSDWGIISPGKATIRSGATLRKIGTNEITISGVNISNEGTLSFISGTTALAKGTALVGTGKVSVGAAALVTLGSATDRQGVTLSQITELRGGTIFSNPILDGTHSLDNLATVYATSTFAGDGILVVNGPLVAPSSGLGGGIIKNGNGILLLNANNSYLGTTTINGGTLKLGTNGSISMSPSIEVMLPGILDTSAHVGGYDMDGQLLILEGQVAGSINAINGSTITSKGSNSQILQDLSVSDSAVRVGGVGFNEGEVSTLHIGGDYLQQADATLEFDLLDTSEYETLIITGSASLDGDLHVNAIPGFAPDFGESFTVLTANGGITGEFGTVNLPSLAAGKIFVTQYTDTAVTLAIAGSVADFDLDGDVDDADLTIWQQSYALTADGDADADGDTDGYDLMILQREFTGSLAPFTETSVVPEPATNISVCIAAGIFFMIGRTRES